MQNLIIDSVHLHEHPRFEGLEASTSDVVDHK